MTTLVKIGAAPKLKPAQMASILKALADENRLRILSMLKQTGCCSIASTQDQGMCACDIETQLDLSQPTISHHMKVLREAGLVSADKVGSWMWYRRNEDLLQQLGQTIAHNL